MAGKKRILLIEDERDLVKAIIFRLEDAGYDILTAFDGEEGLEKARKDEPDLIILDLMMPKMNGYKVYGLLKDDARYAKIPIIILTAKAQQSDIDIGKQIGANAYITKPFEPEALLGKIKELLKEK